MQNIDLTIRKTQLAEREQAPETKRRIHAFLKKLFDLSTEKPAPREPRDGL